MMATHEEGTAQERANPGGKKGVSPVRNVIAAVLLVALVIVASLEWAANRRSGAAIRRLNETLATDQDSVDLLSKQQVEDLIGRGPDGPGVEENGTLKVRYTWKGVFREYSLTATYKNQVPPKLLRIE